MYIKTFLVAVLTVISGNSFIQYHPGDKKGSTGQDISINVEKNGKILFIRGLVPQGVREIEIRIKSDRNNSISHMKEVSPKHIGQEEYINSINLLSGNVYYPVVDIVVERGMEGWAEFVNCREEDTCIINGPVYKQKQPVKPWVIIPSNVLQSWENSVFINSDSCYLNSFYIKSRYPLVTREIDVQIQLLSEYWEGTISFYNAEKGKELSRSKIVSEDYSPKMVFDGDGLDRDRLLHALEGCVDYTRRSQVNDKSRPANGGLFLFYDLDARLFRSDYWVWGWGPSVAMLLKASDVLKDQKSELIRIAKEIGEASLRFLWKEPGSDLHDIMISRWDRSLRYKDIYLGAITVADALWMAGWAWIPLHEHTGDQRYLDITAHHCQVTDKLLDKWKIIPHSYYFDEQTWSDWVIDETGFGVEGYAEIFRVTSDRTYQDGGRIFINRHIEIFERADGLWNRQYRFSDSTVTVGSRMIRGLGWSMEGLLAANRLLPGEGFLDRARQLADSIIRLQLPDGSWSFKYGEIFSDQAISEKGTALWSYLLYCLYEASNEKKYLDAARKALEWCLNVQYDGNDSDAYGSIVGCSPASAVGYRPWFNVSCTYSSAFMGLAIIKELSLK